MKNLLNPFRFLVVLLFIAAPALPAATNVWSNGGGTKLWSTATDWSPAGPPSTNDTAAFFNGATAPLPGTVNNTLSASAQIAALMYGQSNALYHTTKLNPGVTLTIASTNTGNVLFDGTAGDPGSGYLFTNAITGTGGTLQINATNGNINVRQPTATAGVTTHMAVLDLSGLDTLNATISRLLVAGDSAGNPNNRLQGTLYLAKTNLLIATWQGWTGTNLPAIGVSDGTGGNGGDASFLYLGQTNAVFADSMSVAGFLGGHGLGGFGNTTLAFNPAFTNSNASAYFRGYTTARVGSWAIGDNSSASAKSTASIGVLDLSGGTVDALVDTIWVARSEVSAGGNGAVSTGTLTFGAGTLDVNTLELGYQTGDTTVVYPASGTVNVNGPGTLSVNSGIRLAHQTSPPPNGGLTIPTGTLNVNGGTVWLRGGSIVDGGGHSIVNVNSGLLDLQPPGRPLPASLSAQTLVVGDGTSTAVLTNGASITSPNVTINNGGAIAGNTSFNIGSNGTFTTPGFVLRGTFTGAGSVSGDFTVNPGGGLAPGGSALAGTLAFGGNLMLNAATLAYDLADPTQLGGPNDLLSVSGNLTLTGVSSVLLNALSGVLTNGTYQLITYSGALSGNSANLQVAGALGQSRHTFAFDVSTPNEVNLTVAGNDSASLLWVGDAVNNWDLQITSDWKNGGAADKFYNLDSVTFDDTGSASPAVNLVGTLMPGTITVNNSAKNYAFAGSGRITGGASLVKQGSGSLTFSGTGTNDFTGALNLTGGQISFAASGVIALAGPVTIGTGAGLTVAGSGAATLSGPLTISSAGTLTYNRGDNLSLASPLTGTGSLVKQGAGVLALAGDNSGFDGPILVSAGTLQAIGTTALGTTANGTTINPGATLEINGYNLGAEPVTISGTGVGGNGAVVNDGFAQADALQNVTLAADATFGGTSVWAIRSEPTTTVSTTLSTGGAARKLTKVGPNQVSLTSVAVDAALGDIDIRGGTLSVENLTTGLGNPANTVNLFTNGSLQLLAFQTTSDDPSQFITLNKRIAMNDTSSLVNSGGTNLIVSPVVLSGSNTLNVPLTVRIGSGKGVQTYTNSLSLSGVVSGSGILSKQGGGTLYLQAANSFSGRTLVDNGTVALQGTGSLDASTNLALAGGTLDVTGRSDGRLTLLNGQTLSGNGTIAGNLTANPGSTVSPGTGIGTITITNGSVSLAGTTFMRFSKTNGTSSLINGAATITYGGTLSLTNASGTLVGGESYKLFDAVTYAGAFTNLVPAKPGPYLFWDTTGLITNGTIRIVYVPPPQITGFSRVPGGPFNLAFSGPVGSNYHVWASTNVAATPIPSAWTLLSTGAFGVGGASSYSDTGATNLPRRFYLISVP